MKETTCKFWFNHSLVKDTQENAAGNEFRFVKSCRCGKHFEKSVPLHENDLLGQIDLHSNNFPVDEAVSNTYQKQPV